jgi:hypothetical protein
MPPKPGLTLPKPGALTYEVRDGYVIKRPASRAGAGSDPALRPFLRFLADDMARRPDSLVPTTGDLAERNRDLVATQTSIPILPGVDGDRPIRIVFVDIGSKGLVPGGSHYPGWAADQALRQEPRSLRLPPRKRIMHGSG